MNTPQPVVIINDLKAHDIPMTLVILALNTWFIMLLLGTLHSDYPHVPPLPYGTVLAVLVILDLSYNTCQPIRRRLTRKGEIQ